MAATTGADDARMGEGSSQAQLTLGGGVGEACQLLVFFITRSVSDSDGEIIIL